MQPEIFLRHEIVRFFSMYRWCKRGIDICIIS